MNADQVEALRALLAPTGWLDRTSSFARALRRSTRTPSGLLLVGTSGYEPWHMAAHLEDESNLTGLRELAPTLVRWHPEPDAPAHLSIGLDRLRATTRGETLLVVSPEPAPAQLLERVSDVRKTGATVFALDADDPELDGLAHEALPVRPGIAPLSFEAAQHLVSGAVAEDGDLVGLRHSASRPSRSPGSGEAAGSVRGIVTLRARLARLLDAVSGPAGD
jgi:hypothetical protein